MRVGIASHIAIDTIVNGIGQSSSILGGPPLYCGLICRKFKFHVSLATSVGQDLPEDVSRLLSELGVDKAASWMTGGMTTRFVLNEANGMRELTLLAKCAPIEPNQIQEDLDAWIISPIIDEIPLRTFEAIKSKGRSGLMVLDPQGFLRRVDENGRISIASRAEVPLQGVNIIKVDDEELAALTGGAGGLDGMRYLQAAGIQYVVATEAGVIKLLHKNTFYSIKLGSILSPDSTGAGDILTASFTCSLLRDKDPLWAVCFGAGAVRAALETGNIGLAKVPHMSKIEQSASYFYNTVKFQQL